MRLPIIAALIMSTTSLAYADDLLEIYNIAQNKDPLILQSKAQKDSAYAAIGQAQAANLPQINLNGSVNYTKTNKNDYGTALVSGGSISLQQSIWRHSNFINTSLAEKSATMSDLAYNNAKQDLIIRTCDAYFGVLEASDVLKFAKANQEALKQQYDESNQRFQVGLIANTDVQEAKAAYDGATAQVIIAENHLTNSYENLRQITGMEHKNLAELDVSKFSTPDVQKNSSDLLKTAEENNFTLQRQMIAKEMAKQKISLARTGYEPTLDLIGSIGTKHTNYKEEERYAREDNTINSASIGLEFNMPLYSGGATNAAVDVATADYIAASEALESTHRSIQTNVYSQYNNVNASIGTVKAYNQATISAKSALDATVAGYKVGTRTIVDVLDATQKFYNAESQLASARYNYIMNRLNLKYTIGLLTEEDLMLVNSGLINKKK